MHNSIGYGMQMILSECLTLGVKAGVEAEALVECIRNGSVGRGNLLNVTLPETYFKGVFDPPNFALKLARKDVALALELGREYDVPMGPQATPIMSSPLLLTEAGPNRTLVSHYFYKRKEQETSKSDWVRMMINSR